MKIMAICDIDEDKIKNVSIHETEIIDKVANEFGWLVESGITAEEIVGLNDSKAETQYQAFMWDKTKEKYAPFGRPYLSARICKARLMENVDNGWIPSFLDANKYKICRREVYSITTLWDDLWEGKENELEG